MTSHRRAFASLAILVLSLASADAAEKKPAKGAAAAEKKEEKKEEKKGTLSPDTWAGLAFRSIGPALTSGRVNDIAVHPDDSNTYFVGVASGGVWKTVNNGTTWQPVFDGEGSYSVGCVTIDPNNPAVVWVGTGEYNAQRSVSYGDGVYKSEDGGKSWTNMGLKSSEHIGTIVVDPRDSNVVWVAAQGPLWSAGGDRGLYKSTDGGKNWKAVLTVSEDTGVTDVVLDPRDSDVVYAATWQRRRHVWTVIAGGPESGIHKSTDGGTTWKKLASGLPKEDMGRIGLAVAPSEPDTVYALVDAANETGGTFRSRDRGATWEKRSKYKSGSGQYYTRVVVDPVNPARLYSMDVFLQVSNDAGETWKNLGETSKHIDNHAIWIDPRDNDRYLVGSDGGVYETFDRGESWHFKSNLPVTQFYKIDVDESWPVYNVYGGTQDNFTLGGPSRTLNIHGIANSDWFVLWNGDGFQPRPDPKDPDTVYAQAQHGEIGRFDRKTGEAVYVKPHPAKGEDPPRWNWDSPLIISPHANTRLYFGSQRVYRSDDRGISWKPVSGDLTRGLDRNQLPVMGRVWPPDAVAKNSSTSFYGNLTALSESPKKEGLLWAGTDDGLVQVRDGDGGAWRRIETLPGVPEKTYVSRLEASRHDADTVYAAFNNHKMGDFKPYLLKSGDQGRTWSSIAGDLPARGSVWAVVEDHVDPNLLFAGTEFGVFFSSNGGKNWVRLKGGIPTIAVRDLAIQRRESDLIAGTFGRGLYVLDDYSPLRQAAAVEKPATLYPVGKVGAYFEASPLGNRAKSFQGDSYHLSPNPPFGAVFTYSLSEGLKTRKKTRQEEEKKAEKEKSTRAYPSLAELRAEVEEEDPAILLVVADAEGNVVRRLEGPVAAGVHRVAWDLRFPPADPTSFDKVDLKNPYVYVPQGAPAAPGAYTVTLAKRQEGKLATLAGPERFEVVPLRAGSLPATERARLADFLGKTMRLQRAALGASAAVKEAGERLRFAKKAIDDTPAKEAGLAEEARALEARLREIRIAVDGDQAASRRFYPTAPSIKDRIEAIVNAQWNASGPPTGTSLEQFSIASKDLQEQTGRLRDLVEKDLEALETRMDKAGAPWTPGRVPVWSGE